MAEYIIGIDGGGTRTRGVLANLQGEIIGHTQVGSTNYHSVGLESVEQSIKQIIDQLAGDERRTQLRYICLGLSGVGRPIDFERIGSVLERLGIKDKTYLTNDAVIALIGGALAESGILIIAGTGSIVYGMDAKGNIARAGGYGQFLADEGSGYRIGLKGLIAIMKAFDGRTPPVSFSEPVLKKLQLESPMELVTWIGGLSNVKEEVGKIAPFVLQAAENGDRAALAIINEEIAELVLAVKAVVSRLNFTESSGLIDVVLTGGVLENNIFYFNKLSEAIKLNLSQCNPIRPKAPAVIGAVVAGMQKLNIKPDEKILENLLQSFAKISQS
ncbi:hypothetical protein J7M23_06925 [Candidatus Sumerlaeota bacterium]|nr:hypothetical protein [Candidatus Sumerlaeota bacterium]